MPKAAISSPSQRFFDTIAKEFVSAEAGIKKSNAFGAPCLKVRGKIFACWSGASLVVKLDAAMFAKGMKLKGAHIFNPMGKGKGMTQWLVLPYAQRAKWRAFTQAALVYVASKT
jgi:hypothetical protein